MKKDIIKFFNLQGCFLDKIETKDKDLILNIRSARVRISCPHCGKGTTKIHQYHFREVRHGWFKDKQVILRIRKRRFYCRICNKPFSETIPGIDRKRHSYNFQINALLELKSNSFNGVAKKIKTSASTLTRFLRNLTENKEIFWPKRGEIVLGIDEHSFRGYDLVITVAELKRKRLLAVLKDDQKATLEEFLNNIPDEVKSRIVEVCIDMNSGYREAVKSILPKARIIVDKFHVIREAQRIFEETRLTVQSLKDRRYQRIPKRLFLKGKEKLSPIERAKINKIFEKYRAFPVLEEAWRAKEMIREIYQTKNYQIAELKLKKIILMLEGEGPGLLSQLRETLKRWQPYILNYFYNYTTNAFLEGCHTKIKMIKRISYGFSNIQNYISKITLAFLPLIWLLNYHTI